MESVHTCEETGWERTSTPKEPHQVLSAAVAEKNVPTKWVTGQGPHSSAGLVSL